MKYTCVLHYFLGGLAMQPGKHTFFLVANQNSQGKTPFSWRLSHIAKEIHIFLCGSKNNRENIFFWLSVVTAKEMLYSLAAKFRPPRKIEAAKVNPYWCSEQNWTYFFSKKRTGRIFFCLLHVHISLEQVGMCDEYVGSCFARKKRVLEIFSKLQIGTHWHTNKFACQLF